MRLPRLLSSPPSRLRRLGVATATFAVAAALVTGGATVAASASAPAQTVFVNEGFTGTAVTDYIKPDAPSGVNAACLTASNDPSATPVPGCSTTAIDTAGSGALRLTSAGTTQEGGVGSTESVPISKGLDASFDSYQYGGSKADGIVFYLAATDPYNPQVPTAIGQPGGSLGYSATGGSAGMAHGYLGLGLDDYGNYLNSNFGGSGCTNQPASSTQPTNVSVRGPGNGSVGYCVLPGYNSNLGGATALHSDSMTRSASDVPVEVVINPASTSTTSAGTAKLSPITVAASSYAIVFKTIGASSQTVVTGTLPDLRQSQYAGLVDPSWYDPATGLPYKLTYGWVASTGGSTDIHEVNYLNAQTVNGPVPTLTATSTVASATPASGSTDTYTVTPAVAANGGDETSPVKVTTTFPEGLTPTAYSGADYSCTISGQTETCTYSGTTAAGSSLPALALPFTASGAPESDALTISSVVASVDATAVNTSSDVTIGKIPTTTTVTVQPSSPQYAATETLTAHVSPTAATGTVAFVDTSTGAVLCASAPVANGVATCQVTASRVGTDNITATYSGDDTYLGSAGSTSVTTTTATTTIGVTTSPAEITYGGTTTLTATGIPSGATGTVSFTAADGAVLCTTTAASRSCTTASTLGAGPYAVTSHYSGDTHYAAADSASTAPLTVDQADTTLIDTVNGTSAGTTSYGTAATLAASGIASGAEGTVTFTDASTGATLCTATLPSTSCTTDTGLAAGSYTVHAVYSGDANHASAMTLSDATLTVGKQLTSIAATVNGSATSSVSYGTQSALVATGLPTGATGTVTFTDQNGDVMCSATLPDASCSTATDLAAGSYDVTASYSGDANHDASSAAVVSLTVAKADPSLTTTVDRKTTTKIVHGTTATLDTAGIPADATGTVSYVAADGTILCTATLPDTSCDTATTLQGGTYKVTSLYSGDANHEPSAGPTVTLVVAPQPVTMKAGSSPVGAGSHTAGGSTTLTATGVPAGATGTITFTDSDGTVLCTVTLPARSCTTTALTSGTHTVTVAYSGDPSFAASSATTSVTVPGGALAFTGSTLPIALVSGLAALIMALGATMVVAARRRAEPRHKA